MPKKTESDDSWRTPGGGARRDMQSIHCHLGPWSEMTVYRRGATTSIPLFPQAKTCRSAEKDRGRRLPERHLGEARDGCGEYSWRTSGGSSRSGAKWLRSGTNWLRSGCEVARTGCEVGCEVARSGCEVARTGREEKLWKICMKIQNRGGKFGRSMPDPAKPHRNPTRA